MSEEQRLAWDRKYSTQGAVWSRTHDDWFETADGERVLDLGCGSGKSSASLRGDLVSVDFSMAALRTMRASVPEASAICCDVCALPFADSSFDFVRASFLLGHLSPEERSSAIGEMSRVLRRDGRIAIEVFSTRDGRLLRKGGDAVTSVECEDGLRHAYFQEEDIRAALSSFSSVSLSEERWSQRIGPRESMQRSIIRAIARRS